MRKEIVFLSIVLLIPLVFAHVGDENHLFMEEFEVDIAFDPEVPVVGETAAVSIVVSDQKTGEFVYPARAQIIIYHDERIVAEESIEVESQQVYLETQFDHEGVYVLNIVVFDDVEEVIVEFESELGVIQKPNSDTPVTLTKYTELFGTIPFFIQVLIIIAAIIGIILIDRGQKNKK